MLLVVARDWLALWFASDGSRIGAADPGERSAPGEVPATELEMPFSLSWTGINLGFREVWAEGRDDRARICNGRVHGSKPYKPFATTPPFRGRSELLNSICHKLVRKYIKIVGFRLHVLTIVTPRNHVLTVITRSLRRSFAGVG